MKILIPMGLALLIATSTAGLAKEKTVTLDHSQLSPDKILGSLGKPLGSVVRIRGQVIDGSDTREKALDGKLLLQVSQVDGVKLKNKVTIEQTIPPWAGVEKPKAGKSFYLLGYETGQMSGIPSALFEHLPQMTTTEYHFRVYFVVCKKLD